MKPRYYLALYKGHRDGSGWRVWCARATDWLTRILTRGQYSHCEIAVREHPQASVYTCYSASIRDGGVRCKVMPLSEAKWDLIPLPSTPEAHKQLQRVWRATEGHGYDLEGALGIALKTHQKSDKWFCSEWCAAALGLPAGWRWSPNDLAAIVSVLKREA
nr:MAG TPA: cysteine peptidase [Caudoviricetes sp.]